MDTTQRKNIRRRCRPSVVCLPCKKRKVKCDKLQPCSTCIKNNIESECYKEKWPNHKHPKSSTLDIDGSLPRGSVSQSNPKVDLGKHNDNFNIKSKTMPCHSESINVDQTMVIIKKIELDNLLAKIKQHKHSTSQSINHKPSNNSNSSLAASESTFPKSNVECCFNLISNGIYSNRTHDTKRPGDIDNSNPVAEEILSCEDEDISDQFTSQQILNEDIEHVGLNPFRSYEETINYYRDFCGKPIDNSRLEKCLGPLSWATLSKINTPIQMISRYDEFPKKCENESSVFESYNSHEFVSKSITTSQDEKFKLRSLEVDGFNDSLLYKDATHQIGGIDQFSLSLVINYSRDDFIPVELKILAQIEHLLPNNRMIWLLLKLFFKNVYPFFPFIHEMEFRTQVSELIGNECYNYVKPTLKIRKREDLAIFGILMMVLRISSVSLNRNTSMDSKIPLNSNNSARYLSDMTYLIENPISREIVNCCQLCLQQFTNWKRFNLIVLQFAMYYYAYQTLAPEGGDDIDSGDDQFVLGMVIEMCLLIGLNRDRVNCQQVQINDKTVNIARRIWYFLVFNDLHQSVLYGSPLSFNSDNYDTKLPIICSRFVSIANRKLDANITKYYNFYDNAVLKFLKPIIIMSSNMHERIQVCELTKKINNLELIFSNKFGKLEDYIDKLEEEEEEEEDQSSYSFLKISKVKAIIIFNCYSILNNLYMYYYNHQHKNLDLSYFYMKKLMTASIELIPDIFRLINDSVSIFGEGAAEMILSPYLLQLIYRSNEIILGGIVRGNFQIKCQTKNEQTCQQHLENLYRYVNGLEKCAWWLLAATKILSDRYYNGWKIYKTHKRYLRIVTTKTFYNQVGQGIDLAFTNNQQIISMIEMIETLIEKSNLSNRLIDFDNIIEKNPTNHSMKLSSFSTPNQVSESFSFAI